MIEVLSKLGIIPNNIKLYDVALSHSSYANEHHNKKDYERLEFLGDAVLELVMSEYIYKNFEKDEGSMTRTRANYVCEDALAEYMTDLDWIKYIKVGNGEIKEIQKAIIADIFEALMGAIYLDQGFEIVKKVILSIVEPYIMEKRKFNIDYKSILQEAMQTDKRSFVYETINETGPAHNKEFTVIVKIDNVIYGKGIANSKKEASKLAAKDTLEKLAKNEYE